MTGKRLRLLASILLALAGCSQAYSGDHRPAPMAVAGGAPAATSSSPYGVEIVGNDGRTLRTFEQNGRYYVLGDAGGRYVIHITNPTDQRVEAVATVDGLDVIDGEDGDLHKRGYVVPAHGDLSIEGFRTSTSDVATFRFSSVDESYAGRKGKARNVGVIAVALFAEAPQPAPTEIIMPEPDREPPPPPVVYDDERGGDRVGAAGSGAASAAPPPTATETAHGGGGEGRARLDTATKGEADEGGYYRPAPKDPCCNQPQPTHRSGLGTEYGEQRYSAASWTKFVRASDQPIAIAELRYNDAAGLAALGIQVDGPVDGAEVTKRETADPFPGDPSFAQPPAGIR